MVFRFVKSHLMIIVVGVSFAFSFLNTPETYAHPGNTAADGGHYCWTNCDYWGEVYGQRHFHGGYTESVPIGPTLTEQGDENGTIHATETNNRYIRSSAEIEGKNEGFEHGKVDEYLTENPDSESVCNQDVNFSSPQEEEYMTAFYESYSSSCKQEYNDAYSLAYSDAYESAINQVATIVAESVDVGDGMEDAENNSFPAWLGVVGFYGIIGLITVVGALWENYGKKIKSWFTEA